MEEQSSHLEEPNSTIKNMRSDPSNLRFCKESGNKWEFNNSKDNITLTEDSPQHEVCVQNLLQNYDQSIVLESEEQKIESELQKMRQNE